jgi:hypothetical protein
MVLLLAATAPSGRYDAHPAAVAQGVEMSVYRSGRTAEPAAGMRVVVQGRTIYVPPDLFAAAEEAAIRPPDEEHPDIAAAKALRMPSDLISIAAATKISLAVVVDYELPGPREQP